MGRISKILRNAEDNRLLFWCPGCNRAHQIQHGYGSGNRWGWNGSVDKPTFTPSIHVRYSHPKGYSNENPAPIGWKGEYVDDICHSFVTDGKIQFLDDCTHALAGKTVDLPEFDAWGD
jgi:hypothetical protein